MSEAKLTLNTLFGLPDEKFYTKALSAGMSTEGLVTTKEKIQALSADCVGERLKQSSAIRRLIC